MKAPDKPSEGSCFLLRLFPVVTFGGNGLAAPGAMVSGGSCTA